MMGLTVMNPMVEVRITLNKHKDVDIRMYVMIPWCFWYKQLFLTILSSNFTPSTVPGNRGKILTKKQGEPENPKANR